MNYQRSLSLVSNRVLSRLFSKRVKIGEETIESLDERRISIVVVSFVLLIIVPVIILNFSVMKCAVTDFIGISLSVCQKKTVGSYSLIATKAKQESLSTKRHNKDGTDTLAFAYLNSADAGIKKVVSVPLTKRSHNYPTKKISKRAQLRRPKSEFVLGKGALLTARLGVDVSSVKSESNLIVYNEVDIVDERSSEVVVPRGAQIFGRLQNYFGGSQATNRLAIDFHTLKIGKKSYSISAEALGADGNSGVLGVRFSPKKKKFLGEALRGVLSGLGASIPLPGAQAASELSRNLIQEARNSARRGADSVTEGLRLKKEFVYVTKGTPLVVLLQRDLKIESLK